MDVARYLARIGYDGEVAPTADVLRELHRRHLLTVPFENLDIHRKRAIVIDEEAFQRKVVDERRGGFCYELNGAFGNLLRAIGFPVTNVSARPWSATTGFGPEFDHLALIVTADGVRWLADVGFGESFLEPLRLDERGDQRDPAGLFRIEEREAGELVLRGKRDDIWFDAYVFTLTRRALADFAEMCRFHSTSPESHFTRKRLCSLARMDGRITLSDLRLITTKDGVRTERELAGEDEWRDVLRGEFGVAF